MYLIHKIIKIIGKIRGMFHVKDLSVFKNDLKELHIDLSEQAIQQFLDYYELLVEWNSFMNLTAITDFDDVLKKHFIDSLSFIKANDLIKKHSQYDFLNQNITMIDIGTGAGFPGIPLKIAFPNLKVTLLDSLNKRVQFLNSVIDKLGLTDIVAVHGRAEDFARNKDYREQYDVAVSRAVANMSTLSEYCVPFIKQSGFFIPFKSEKLPEELSNAQHALDVLGCHLIDQVEFDLPNSDLHRNLVIIQKEKNTPSKYPRKAGVPSKSPL